MYVCTYTVYCYRKKTQHLESGVFTKNAHPSKKRRRGDGIADQKGFTHREPPRGLPFASPIKYHPFGWRRFTRIIPPVAVSMVAMVAGNVTPDQRRRRDRANHGDS